MFNLLSNFAIDTFEPIAKWLAIGVVSLALVVGLLTFFVKKKLFLKIIKPMIFSLFVFLLVIGLTLLGMDIAKEYSESELGSKPMDTAKYLLIPFASFLFLILISTMIITIVYKKSSQEKINANVKMAFTICGIICLIALLVIGVLLGIYFNKIKDWYEGHNSAMLYVSSAIVVIAIVTLAIVFGKNKKPFNTRCIALAGITVAMSFGLSYIKLWRMPQAGSVTLLSLLPIMIFSNIYGTKKGVFVCFIYGVLQAIQDPWIIHPAQFLLDYAVAYSAIGLSGMFAEFKSFKKFPQVSFMLGGIVAGTLRFISHVLSGVFAFPSTDNPLIYSLGYNSTVLVEVALAIVAGVIVFSSKAFLKELEK